MDNRTAFHFVLDFLVKPTLYSGAIVSAIGWYIHTAS